MESKKCDSDMSKHTVQWMLTSCTLCYTLDVFHGKILCDTTKWQVGGRQEALKDRILHLIKITCNKYLSATCQGSL